MTALIKLENVTKHYGTFQALSKINLDVKEGEVVCVIGPSGSGKSPPGLRVRAAPRPLPKGIGLINNL